MNSKLYDHLYRGGVSQSLKDGDNWYRRYNDGWVEQGGHAPSGENVTVTLHIPFQDAFYNVLITPEGSGHAYAKAIAKGKTAQTFTLTSYMPGSINCRAYWLACGYAAE